jgi:hypothetical protein
MYAQKHFTIIAHRGDSSAAPENTVQAFDFALQQGFCNFETDCQLSSDGAVVIVHDEQLGRVNDGTGKVADHTLAQLQQLDAGSWFGAAFAGARMPTLQQLLERYKGRSHIHLVSGRWGRPEDQQLLCHCCWCLLLPARMSQCVALVRFNNCVKQFPQSVKLSRFQQHNTTAVHHSCNLRSIPSCACRSCALLSNVAEPLDSSCPYCLQELKSQQPQLPAAAAALIQQHGWHNLQAASAQERAAALQQPGSAKYAAAAADGAAPAAAAAAGTAAAAFGVPGLTITSFQLQQLQASKQVGCALHCMTITRVGKYGWPS